MIEGARIVVTGGTGSFGRAFIERALMDGARKVISVSSTETKQQQPWVLELARRDKRFLPRIRNVRDYEGLCDAFYKADIVIHAAALKRVDTGETDYREFIKTNDIGTDNVLRAAMTCGVKRVVYLSSDKACEPVTAYGITKAVAEWNAVKVNEHAVPRGSSVVCTRYGNVAGSQGSVINVWREQAKHGGPLSGTVPYMTRYWMLMREAVELVLAALERGHPGEIWIPKLRACRLDVLAEAIAPGVPVEWSYRTRGVEKEHEVLIHRYETRRTHDLGDFYVIEAPEEPWTGERRLRETLADLPGPYTSETCYQMGVEEVQEMLTHV